MATADVTCGKLIFLSVSPVSGPPFALGGETDRQAPAPRSPMLNPPDKAEAVSMASKKFLRLAPRERFTVLNLGDMEIWDGADMALLRESLTRLIKAEKHRAIGVDMSHVKYIPSGFFGMLFDWYESEIGRASCRE